MNNVFENRSKEEEIYPLKVKEISKAQKAWQALQGNHTKREV
jgi:hypothetical protein